MVELWGFKVFSLTMNGCDDANKDALSSWLD